MSLIGVVLCVIALVVLIQGILVFIQPGPFTKRLFFLVTAILGAIWSIGLAVFLVGYNENQLLFSAKVYYIAIAFLSWAMIAFAVYSTNRLWRHTIVIVTAIPCVLISIWMIHNPLIASVTLGLPNIAYLNIDNYLWYVAYIAIYVTIAISILINGVVKTDSALERRRLTYILIAYAQAFIISGIFNLILPGLGNYTLIWIGPISILIFVTIIFVAIIRFRLFNMRSLAIRLLAWSTIGATIATVYMIAFIAIQQLELDSQVIPLVTAIIGAIFTIIFYQVIQRLMVFVLRTFELQLLNRRLLDEISHIALRSIEAHSLVKNISIVLSRHLDKDSAVSIILYINSKKVYYSTNEDIDNTPDIKRFVSRINKDIIITEEIADDKSAYNFFVSKNISAIVRINGDSYKVSADDDDDDDDESYGYLIIHTERSILYSQPEAEALTTIGNIVSMAIKNIRHYDLIKKFNTELEKRIVVATHDLQVTNNKLTMLNAAKDEFLSITSHQLRTPLTVIKGQLSMLLTGDFGELNSEQVQVVNNALDNSKQMASTVGDFLDITRIESGKFVVSKSPINITELVKFQVAQLEDTAKDRNVSLICKIDDNLPKVNADQEKISQVVMNFIDNAIQYSEPESDTIEINLSKVDDNIIFKVRDHGIGVPKEAQRHMFTKFYRATNAKQARPDGNGIGLYIANKIINAHGGDIIFESQEGKGSTFGFKIPITAPPH